MNPLLKWVIGVAILIGLCCFFPLFHIVPLERAAKEREATAFNPTQFAEKFWTNTLLKSLDKAVKAEVLLPAIQANPSNARNSFSHSLGVSDSYIYFVSGTGRVLTATEDEITLAVTDGAATPEISLQTGLIFGNTLRDGTGLLSVNDYPNSQDFNGISEALNHIVETTVQPKLREQARVGAIMHFTGCAEVNDESTDLKPLKVVPIQVEMSKPN